MGNCLWGVRFFILFCILFISPFAAQVSAAGSELSAGDSELAILLESQGDNVTEQLVRLAETRDRMRSSTADWSTINRRLNEAHEASSRVDGIIQGLYGALGGAVGGAVTGGVTGASPAGIALGFVGGIAGFGLRHAFDAIYEAITHKRRNAELLQAFENAMTRYKQFKRAITDVEEKIKSQVYVMSLVNASESRDAFVGSLQKLMANQEVQEGILRDMAALATSNVQAATQIHSMSIEVEATKQRLAQMLQAVQAITNESACARLEENTRVLIDAEALLQDERVRLMNHDGEKVWLATWDKAFQKDLKWLSQYDAKTKMKRLKHESDQVEANFESQLKADSDLYLKINKSYKRCIKERTGLPMELSFLALPGSKRECWSEVTHPMSSYADSYIERISELHKLKTNLLIRIESRRADLEKIGDIAMNTKLYENAVAVYLGFFDSIVAEQSVQSTNQRVRALEQMRASVLSVCPQVQVGAVY